jgi:hypothetical protein
MIRVESGGTGGEQLVVLWTWLLKGYVPVAHIVAEPDESEVLSAGGVDNSTSDNASPTRGRVAPWEAAA